MTPSRPPGKLFEWRFKQTVLVNMTGLGELDIDDFPPGFDDLGEIRHSHKSAERMAFELSNRLRARFPIDPGGSGEYSRRVTAGWISLTSFANLLPSL
jgi:hypothetical protein